MMTDKQKRTISAELYSSLIDIIENFNFNNVKRIMDALSWHWDLQTCSPEIKDIKRFAIDLLKRAAVEKFTISSGGFEASYIEDDNGKEKLRLRFIVEEWIGEFNNE